MYFDEETFDPENIEHWLLLLTFIGATVYGFCLAYKMPRENGKHSYKYNRQTGKVERNED